MAFRETRTVNGTATYTGNWCLLGGGVPHNYTVVFKLGTGGVGTWKLEMTNSPEQEITAGAAIVDDMPAEFGCTTPAASTINATTDAIQSARVANLTASAARWSYTHVTGTNITATVDTVIQRVI